MTTLPLNAAPQQKNLMTRPALFLAVSVGLFASVAATNMAAASGNAGPSWRPAITEKLVKLPNSYLKKALDKGDRDMSEEIDRVKNAVFDRLAGHDQT